LVAACITGVVAGQCDHWAQLVLRKIVLLLLLLAQCWPQQLVGNVLQRLSVLLLQFACRVSSHSILLCHDAR
jgi:hypothetical protein